VHQVLPLSEVIPNSAVGYLLETPSIRWYSFLLSHPLVRVRDVSSEYPSGADNQQERPGFAQWVVGFVDGEGCFSVPIFRNRSCRLGWQVQPSFAVVQSERSAGVLHDLQHFFGCGNVTVNRRADNHRQAMHRYEVRALNQLEQRIVPFFEEHPLRTAKADEFRRFAAVVSLMREGVHLTVDGLERIGEIAANMNHRRTRFTESSEAIRQPPHLDG